MRTECPHCGQHYEVEEEFLNQIVECTACTQEFVVEIVSEQNIVLSQQNVAAQGQTETSNNTAATIEQQGSGGGLKALSCEMCGSTDMLKQGGVFVCQSCGTKYSLEEAKKMMIAGTVNVAGTVKVDISEKLKKLYVIARRAKDENNSANAVKYYDLIIQEAPESWEASFYLIYFKTMECRIREIAHAAATLTNSLENVVNLVLRQIDDRKEQKRIFQELTKRSIDISVMLGNAATNHFNGIDAQIRLNYTDEYVTNTINSAGICYALGDIFEAKGISSIYSCQLWKNAINIHKMCVKYGANKAFLENYANKIRKFDPTYTLPDIPGACYIATAVYGSYDCPEVWTLRRYRDNVLGASWYGRLFIITYYAISPTVVQYFGRTRIFQKLWRGKLDAFVKKLNDQGISSKPYADKNW